MKLNKRESKDLALYLEKMDKKNDGIPPRIQDIGERAYYYSGLGNKDLKAMKKKRGTFAKKKSIRKSCKRSK